MDAHVDALIVFPSALRTSVLGALPDEVILLDDDGLTAIAGFVPRELERSFGAQVQLQTIRLMDRFHLAFHPMDAHSRHLVTKRLFEFIADSYEDLIDAHLNRLVIAALLSTALDAVPHHRWPVRVLDWGCGTGLITSIAIPPQVQLVGFDQSRAMRERAAAHGLLTLDDSGLAALASGSIDAVIASYVFHLGVDASDALRISRLLPPGGVVVANFHKGIGFSEAVETLGAHGVTLRATPTSALAGPLYLFSR